MKILLPILMLVFSNQAQADDLRWTCFVSKDQKKPIHLAFAFASATKGAQVSYKNGSGAIRLVQKRVESIEMAEGRPHEFTYEYEELINGITGGKYTVVFQGAIFYKFDYQAKGKPRNYRFVMDPESQNDGKCAWQ